MTVENDFLVWAPSGGNVMTQANYAANAGLANGVTTGIADPTLYNKSQRQASIIMAMIADFIVAQTSQPAIDDGTTATLMTNFEQALRVSAFPTGLNTLSTTTTLTASNAGTFYNVVGSGITVTLNTATFSAGQTVGFLAENAFTLAASSSTFYGGSLGSASSIAMPPGSFLALQFDGANWRQLAGSFLAIPTGVQAFATPGTTTMTVPAGVYFILAKIWAGGGGGAGGAPTTGTSFAGTGAGGGGYALKVIPVVPGQTITIVIGAGGAGGPAQSSGGTGGASSIAVNGVTISASGGSGGQYQASFGTFQAAGGIGSGGTENLTGGAGGISQAGPSNNGLGGPGGNGAGGGGQGGVASSAASSPGITPGGGGGGAGGPGALSGGSGANGYAEISY